MSRKTHAEDPATRACISLGMKASVLHEYGPPKVLKYEDFDDPTPGPGEVLISVAAVSINPVDWKMRSGEAKERFPVEFPGILGRDVSGIVFELGEGVTGFTEGQRVFALGHRTYAEKCVVPAVDLARVPEGLELTVAATIPLVSCTADQLICDAANVQAGQTILLTGALGSVGRCAMYRAIELGAKVIAGVRAKQKDDALKLGAVEAIDLNDDDELASVGLVDAVADTVGGATATKLLAKVKPGGRFASLLGPPAHAALHPTVDVHAMMAEPNAGTLVHFAEAVRDGKLVLPLDRIMNLADAAEAHADAEKGGIGKIVLVP